MVDNQEAAKTAEREGFLGSIAHDFMEPIKGAAATVRAGAQRMRDAPETAARAFEGKPITPRNALAAAGDMAGNVFGG